MRKVKPTPTVRATYVFAGEVSRGENYSNLFYTPQATYLPLLFLRQPISKLDTHALSLSP